MDDLIKKYFEKIGKTEYLGRKDLFCFMNNAKKINFGCNDNVMQHYIDNGINIVVVYDQYNLM